MLCRYKNTTHFTKEEQSQEPPVGSEFNSAVDRKSSLCSAQSDIHQVTSNRHLERLFFNTGSAEPTEPPGGSEFNSCG